MCLRSVSFLSPQKDCILCSSLRLCAGHIFARQLHFAKHILPRGGKRWMWRDTPNGCERFARHGALHSAGHNICKYLSLGVCLLCQLCVALSLVNELVLKNCETSFRPSCSCRFLVELIAAFSMMSASIVYEQIEHTCFLASKRWISGDHSIPLETFALLSRVVITRRHLRVAIFPVRRFSFPRR